MKKANSSALDKLLDEINPLEQAITNAKMMLAARIADAMEAKNWKNIDLLKAVGKDNPPVITKWLSGTHNFTIETLVEISRALGISLLDLEEKNKEIITITYSLQIQSEVNIPKNNFYLPRQNDFRGVHKGSSVKHINTIFPSPKATA